MIPINRNHTLIYVYLTFAALCLIASATFADAEDSGHPSVPQVHRPWIWRVGSPTNVVWMAGVLHVAGTQEQRLYPPYTTLLGSVSYLYCETLPGTWETLNARRLLDHRGSLARSNSLRDQVSPQTWQLIEPLAARFPGVFPDITRFRPWLAALEVEKAAYRQLDLNPESGLEAHMVSHALRLGRPIGAMESAAEQIGPLASMSRREQEVVLNDTLREFAAGSPGMIRVREAWMAGDLTALLQAQRMNAGQELTPLQRALLEERNRKWAKKIEKMLDGREPAMVLVGVNHLIAPGIGLPELLKLRGYDVSRVR